MYGRKRCKSRWLSPVAGFLVALLVVEMVHNFLLPNIIPGLISQAEAAYNTIEADGDGSVAASQTTCGGGGNYDCLDDGVATSSSPSTTGDYLTFNSTDQDYYTMQTISGVDTVSVVTVPVYHLESATNMSLAVSLWDAAESTQYGSEVTFGNAAASTWDTATFSGLSLSQSQLDGLRVRLSCTRSGGKPGDCKAYSAFASVTYSEQIDVTVGSLGTQQDLKIGTTTAYVGAAFSIVENTSSRNITDITITEQGTVDALNDLDNIKLFYEIDNVTPYNCASVSYNGTETQFGSTDTSGFSSANGTSSFSGSVAISTTATMCVYVVLDVLSTASQPETLEIQISDPTVDVVGSGTPVIEPATAVLLPDTTTLLEPVMTQENYHWRNDDGNESGATSATGGSENTTYDTFPKSVTKRLRLAISNEGNDDSAAQQYRLEFATKVTTCSVATGWTDVGAGGGDFDMFDTGNLTNGDDTTNISVASGGVSDPNTTFLTTNAGVRDTTSQTGNITATSTEFFELEYAIRAAGTVSDGTTYCFRVTDAGTAIDAYTNYPEATIAADVLVDSTGTQVATVVIPATDQNLGGDFRLTDNTAGAGTVTSITITASGTADAQNDISNIQLRYDLDVTNPYTCDDHSYSGSDTQYGSTATNFNGSNKAVFTGSVSNSPTQTVCLYVEYNVESSAANGETLDVYIADPSTEVVVSGASVSPSSPVHVSGMTTLAAPFVTQANYHWRNNDGNEAGASSATGGSENTTLADLVKTTPIRLRFALGNTGLASAPESRYRLEWAQKITTCSAAASWTRVDTSSDAWEMSPTGNLTEGADTTDIIVADGGVSDPATTFLINNNGVNDTTDLTASSTLLSENYLDLEYAIKATTNAVQGATYCFRVTAAGTTLDSYTNYPEVSIKLDTDYKIQRGVFTMTASATTLVAGTDYDTPSTSARSFIRITNTQLTGAGPNTGNSNSNADDVTVYITNPGNILNSVTFQRAASPSGNTRVSWEIIEYIGATGGENEMIVRRHEAVAYSGAGTTVSGATTNTIVNDNDVVVFITAQHNQDAGRNSYHYGLSTAAWNTGTNQVDLTRGAGGSVSNVSYALVEFTGANWKVQRSENTFTTAGAVETKAITAVNSLSRTFLHVQKRTGQSNHADFGHEVWLSGIGQVSYLIDAAAGSPTDHTSVAWVIENTQTDGVVMVVTRANGSLSSGGSGPETNNINIGKTLDDLSVTTLFVSNRSDEVQRSWPEPILGARLISTTQYELWRSDTTANINYRTAVVEWPTAARKLEQNYYRLYVDNNALKPTDPWPAGGTDLGENTEMTADDEPLALTDTVRIRLTLTVTSSAMPATLDAFKLQFAERVTTCSAASAWLPLGEIGSTTAAWRGVNNTPAAGTALSGDPPTAGDLVVSIATVAGTYEEQNDSALNPHLAFPGDEVEYDWVVQHNGANDKSSYCFRMVESDGDLLEKYNFYPVIRTVGFEPVIKTWRWYDDETNLTPVTPLAATNTAPIDIQNENILKLRVTLKESSGAAGDNNKFIVQYSEYADFSQAVKTLTGTSTCTVNSIWCYADGAGVDNAVVDSVVLPDADACVAGVGVGCGTHNEGTSTIGATFDQEAYASTEYEFTLQHAGARANAVYYFRLYDVTTDEVLGLGSTSTYPSLVTEGAQLVFTVGGVDAGTTVAGVVTDATTTPTTIDFGSVPFNTNVAVAQRITVDTNATEGYQVFKFADQQLLNIDGEQIVPVTGTNATPSGWLTGCDGAAISCFGYHTTDATLEGPSGRFAPLDSYAALSTNLAEIMYSSIPVVDVHDVLYRIRVSEEQIAGDYETGITYIAVPVF